MTYRKDKIQLSLPSRSLLWNQPALFPLFSHSPVSSHLLLHMCHCTYSFLIVMCPSPPHLRASSSSSWGEGVSPDPLSARHCAEHLICIISCSVQFSHSVVSNSLRPHGLQHTRPPCPSPTPRVYSNSSPLSR